MKDSPGRRAADDDVVDDHPFRGGLTGILLVALATGAVSAAAAVVVAVMLLVAG